MAQVKKSLVLTFGTLAKNEESITIANPKEVLSGIAIKKAMDDALASNAIGEVVQANSVLGAKFVIQQVDDVDFEEA
ncbi:MAG: DUF2922 family protein [Niameybacter sp.]|uniref:DUF2922 family protein n=1 Tax=Niameybacter sp. TaxID=2033640 RepID=UPI002FC716B4